MNVYDHYTDGYPVGMDHPLFMARMQAWIDASTAASAGISLAEALGAVRARTQDLFGAVPLGLIDVKVALIYTQRDAECGGGIKKGGHDV